MASDYSDPLMENADDLTTPHGKSLSLVETGGSLPQNLPSTGNNDALTAEMITAAMHRLWHEGCRATDQDFIHWNHATKCPIVETYGFDSCEHEHTFSCMDGSGWNSGCCGREHVVPRPVVQPYMSRRSWVDVEREE